MPTVFIAGSISISHLHEKVQERISNIVSSKFNVVVGDADGADTSIQRCLREHQARHVTVYCTGDTPRNNVADWPVHHVHSKAREGSRAYFTAKDLEMARGSDYGLMIWDCKSPGTLSNVIELLKENKKTVVFVNKNKDFLTIADNSGLNHLLTFMSEHARSKAEAKIGLSAKLAELSQERLSWDMPSDEQSAPMHANQIDSAIEVSGVEARDSHAESVKLRSELISILRGYMARTLLDQTQAAKVFGVAEFRIADLIQGQTDLFGLDDLVDMASMAGLRIEMRVRDIEAIKLSPSSDSGNPA